MKNNEKILVLHMFREFEIGGIQSFIKNIYSSMDRSKIEFDFLLNNKGILDDEIKNMGSKIFYIPYIKEVGPIKYKKNLKEFLISHPEYKILHLHFDQFNGLIAKVAKECGVKTIISHSHIINNTTSFVGKIYKSFLAKNLKYATNYFACSEAAAKYLYKGKISNVKIIPNGIDLKKFEFNKEKRIELRKKYNINDNTKVFGHTGRFSIEKNHDFLIDVFNKYHEKNQNSLLLLIGDGPEMKNIKNKVNDLELNEHVLFLGAQKNISDFYNVFDIFLFPSLFEGLGISLIEAQASGLPCIASINVPIESKITDNILYVDYNIDNWIKSIDSFNKFDRKKMYGYLKDSIYNIENVSNLLFEFYDKISDKGDND